MVELRHHNGSVWKEAQGAFHDQYTELAIWILIYEDFDLEKANDVFWSTFSTFRADLTPLSPFVSYYLKAESRLGIVDTSISPENLSGRWARQNEYEIDIDWRQDGPHSIFSVPDSSRP